MSSTPTPAATPAAIRARSLARTAWLHAGLLALLVLPFAGCDGGGPTNLTLGTPGTPDTTTPPTVPPDTVHGDSVPVPNPDLQDTIIVDPWTGSGPYPSVKVRMDFRDPEIAGTFVYHCHILDHEDGGMMAKIEVDPN